MGFRGAFSHITWRLICYLHGLSLEVDLDHLAEVAFVTFLPCGVTPYTTLFSCRNLWRKSVCTARIWGVSLENGVSTYVIWNSSQREICLLPIYLLFSHLFISICTHRSLIHTLGSNPILLYYFLLKLFQFWPLETLSVAPEFSWHTPIKNQKNPCRVL